MKVEVFYECAMTDGSSAGTESTKATFDELIVNSLGHDTAFGI